MEQDIDCFINLIQKDGKSSEDKEELQNLSLNLIQYADTNGLLPEQLEKLCDICCGDKIYPSVSMTKVIRILIPATEFPEESLKKLITKLISTDVFSGKNEKLLLKWILGLTFYDLGTKNTLNGFFYNFFHMFLREESVELTSRIICNLCDKKEDGTGFLIKNLERMQKRNHRRHIDDLLKFFGDGRDLKKVNLITCFTKGFQNAAKRFCAEKVDYQDITYSWRVFQPANRKGDNLRRAVPACSYHNENAQQINNIDSIWKLEEIPGNSVDIPNRAMALLASPLGFHQIAFSDVDVQKRVANNLIYTLHRVIYLDEDKYPIEEKTLLLKHLVDFQEFCLQGIPSVSEFLTYYLLIWDGEDFQTEIFQLMEWALLEQHELWPRMETTLRQLFRCSEINVKVKIIRLCTIILKNSRINGKRALLDIPRPFLLEFEDPLVVCKTIQRISQFAAEMITEGLAWCPKKHKSRLLHESLFLYTMSQDIEKESEVPTTAMIPVALVQHTLSSLDVACVTGLCRILNRSMTETKERLYMLGIYDDFADYFENILYGLIMDCYRAFFVGLDNLSSLPGQIFVEAQMNELRALELPRPIDGLLRIEDNLIRQTVVSEEIQRFEMLVKTLLA